MEKELCDSEMVNWKQIVLQYHFKRNAINACETNGLLID